MLDFPELFGPTMSVSGASGTQPCPLVRLEVRELECREHVGVGRYMTSVGEMLVAFSTGWNPGREDLRTCGWKVSWKATVLAVSLRTHRDRVKNANASDVAVDGGSRGNPLGSLDKLGVTGSSPVAPTSRKPRYGGVFVVREATQDSSWQQNGNARLKQRPPTAYKIGVFCVGITCSANACAWARASRARAR